MLTFIRRWIVRRSPEYQELLHSKAVDDVRLLAARRRIRSLEERLMMLEPVLSL